MLLRRHLGQRSGTAQSDRTKAHHISTPGALTFSSHNFQSQVGLQTVVRQLKHTPGTHLTRFPVPTSGMQVRPGTNGGVTLLLGIIIHRQLPEAALWVIGLFIGIEMIFNGWAWIMMSLGLRAVAKSA